MMDLTKLYERQIEFTEWLARIGSARTESMRKEDNEKRRRLGVLHEAMGLPYDEPRSFLAIELAQRGPAFERFLAGHGDELCALRLMPVAEGLPTLRMRGLTIRSAMEWFAAQRIDPAKYRADFVPHPREDLWGTIFVVNRLGVFGEIIRGGHHQLTQGFHHKGRPITFSFDFSALRMDGHDDEAEAEVRKAISMLRVDKSAQQALAARLGSTFAHDYLCGYFETACSERGTWFIDYNRVLGELFKDFVLGERDRAGKDRASGLTGQTGSPGRAGGRVRIVARELIGKAEFLDGDVLVCIMTSPDYLPLMQKAAAIVTDQGGILSHAAIVARELNKPCIVGTGNATSVLREGELVEVDADGGFVRAL